MKEENQKIEALKRIDAYLSGDLSEQEVDAFWEWIFENPEYHDMLRLEAGLRGVIKKYYNSDKTAFTDSELPVSGSEPVVEEEPAGYLTVYRNWIVAAAAVLVLVIGLNLFQLTGPNQPSAPFVTGADQLDVLPEIDLFELESIAAYRGDEDEDPEPELTELFDRSTTAAVRGEDRTALQIYDDIIQNYADHPLVGKAYMNAGILHYNSANYERAVESLQGAVEQPVDEYFEQKAWWYMGHAEMNLGRYEEAREAMFMAYGLPGVYQREAFRQLRSLDHLLGRTDYQDIEPEDIDP